TPTHAHPAMSPPSDIPQPQQPPDQVAAAEPSGQDPLSPGTRSDRVAGTGRVRGAAGALRAAAADNLMVAIFGPVIVLLLGYSLYTTNDRFDDIDNRFGDISNDFATVNDRFGEINLRLIAHDARFAAQDAKIDALDAKIDEINLKLTALIATLNKAEEVDAAVSGELIQSG
ncbi:MAG: hypothetical protein OXI83_16770, partial [Gemmatimonadota bacterium]|nr:hypothetical protein [Gemmatimonadota bacterium]